MEENDKSKLVVVVVVIALVAAGFYLVWRYYGGREEVKTPPTLGEQVSSRVTTPTESVPDVNPYKAETNPFEKANPLKNIYRNPFAK